ncbi:hypothetical protein K502DRAFT_346649 [Neoconidiobolus thromboides FSU 785]|nr:hypothetical protein K502DRAFT_346649 [Neoconidiobolus thromboides FSU 785]
MGITIIYGKNKVVLYQELTSERELNKISLSQLKEECSNYFNILKENITLIYAGAKMKDDLASLASYGINFRSKIVLLVSVGKQIQSEEKSNTFETRQYEQIRSSVNNTLNLVEKEVNSFIEFCDKKQNVALTLEEKKEIEKSYLYLNESLIKGLFTLDNISAIDETTNELNEQVRNNRKSAVNEIQQVLNKLELLYSKLIK